MRRFTRSRTPLRLRFLESSTAIATMIKSVSDQPPPRAPIYNMSQTSLVATVVMTAHIWFQKQTRVFTCTSRRFSVVLHRNCLRDTQQVTTLEPMETTHPTAGFPITRPSFRPTSRPMPPLLQVPHLRQWTLSSSTTSPLMSSMPSRASMSRELKATASSTSPLNSPLKTTCPFMRPITGARGRFVQLDRVYPSKWPARWSGAEAYLSCENSDGALGGAWKVCDTWQFAPT